MASSTQIYMRRNQLKLKKQGVKGKKKREKQGTTPTRAAFFGDTKEK